MQHQRDNSQELNNTKWWKTEQQSQTFRMSYLWVFAFYLGTLGLSYFLHPLYHSGKMPPEEFFRSLIYFAIASLFLYIGFPIKVSEGGIQGHNCFGIPTRLRWEEIERVSLFHMGLPWLRIASKQGGMAMYMPAFLQDRGQFFQAVQQQTPAENPLRQYLEARGKKH
jgi:hypothetical protein